MGRKQSFTKTELLDMTKKLVLEHGYDGFHLKLLSQHLSGARSTIYQYYANKEEIVAACMKRVIADVLEQASAVDESDPMKALEELLLIYVQEAALHQLLGDANKINTSNSPAAARDLEFIEDAHQTLKIQLSRLFERAQQNKSLRQDIPLPVLIGVFFNLFNTPNMMNIPTADWGRLLFQTWIGGAKN